MRGRNKQFVLMSSLELEHAVDSDLDEHRQLRSPKGSCFTEPVPVADVRALGNGLDDDHEEISRFRALVQRPPARKATGNKLSVPGQIAGNLQFEFKQGN